MYYFPTWLLCTYVLHYHCAVNIQVEETENSNDEGEAESEEEAEEVEEEVEVNQESEDNKYTDLSKLALSIPHEYHKPHY